MQKTIRGAGRPAAREEGWLDLEPIADVEVTSEHPEHPIEHALVRDSAGHGWRAGGPGPQTIRLVFREPVALTRIQLLFEEHSRGRTQEFVLRWSAGAGAPVQEIVRQQYNFSAPGTTIEQEQYNVDLAGVRELELSIVPDVGGGEEVATLKRWRVG